MEAHKSDTEMYSSNDLKIALLDKTIITINETLVRFEKRFDQIDQKFDQIDRKLDKLDCRMWSLFKWAIGAFAVTWGIAAHGFHWF